MTPLYHSNVYTQVLSVSCHTAHSVHSQRTTIRKRSTLIHHITSHTAAYSPTSTLPLELACSADCSDSHLACQLAVSFGCQRLGEDVGDHQLGADVW